jgi:hypothetical protein
VLIVLNKQRRLSRERYGSNRRYYVSRNLITWSRVPLRHPYRSSGPRDPDPSRARPSARCRTCAFGSFACVGPLALACAIARHVELQNHCVMDHAIDGSRGRHRLLEDPLLFAEDQIAGDQHRAPFVALGDQREQHLAAARLRWRRVEATRKSSALSRGRENCRRKSMQGIEQPSPPLSMIGIPVLGAESGGGKC